MRFCCPKSAGGTNDETAPVLPETAKAQMCRGEFESLIPNVESTLGATDTSTLKAKGNFALLLSLVLKLYDVSEPIEI